jgi:hypothetical protein
MKEEQTQKTQTETTSETRETTSTLHTKSSSDAKHGARITTDTSTDDETQLNAQAKTSFDENDDSITEESDNTLRNLIYIVLGIIFVVILFVIIARFYIEPQGPENYEYDGYTFTKVGSVWQTTAFRGEQQYDVLMYYGPRDIVDIPIQKGLYEYVLSREFIYLALNETALDTTGFAPQGALAGIEVGKVVGTKNNILNKQTSSALVGRFNETDTFSCDKVSADVGMIIFTISDTNQVYYRDGCVYVEGTNGENLIKAADRFMLQLVGIMME